MGKAIRITLCAVLVPPFAALAAVLVLGGPVGLAWETWELIRMRAATQGRIESIRFDRSSKGSRPLIRYRYRVAGEERISSRLMPGFFGRWGRWTGAESLAAGLSEGDPVTVHYDPSNPARACLEFGWFKWSVGLTIAVWGTALAVFGASRAQSADAKRLAFAAARITPFFGILLVIFAPSILRPAELHWYVLLFAAA